MTSIATPASRAKLQTCDYVVINGENSSQEMLSKAVSMQLVPGKLFALDSNMTWRLSQFAGCRVNAVAAISNPERCFETLEQAGLILERHSCPDHHDFQADDFSGLSLDFPIIMTEKDAVKCRSLKLGNSWFLSIDAVLPGDFEKALLQDIFTSVQAQEVST